MTEYPTSPIFWIYPLLLIGIFVSAMVIWSKKAYRNPLALGRAEHRLPNWNLPWIDFLLLIFTIFIFTLLAQKMVGLFMPELEGDASEHLTPQIALLSILSMHLPIGLGFICFQRFYLKKQALVLNPIASRIKTALSSAGRYFLQLLPLIWILSILWNICLGELQKLNLIDDFPVQPLIELLVQDMSAYYFLSLALSGIILAPIVEEVIFRGCLYRFLKSRMTLLSAQWVSAFIFALLHGNLHSFLPLLFIGLILARLYESSGSIYQSIAFHGFFNGTTFLFLALLKYSGLPLQVFFP